MSTRNRVAVVSWAFAGLVYFAAVLNRSSLGVAGLLAEQRFGITPGQLSIFIFLQVGVYAAMQVPTGILVDRYGPRRLLVVAAATMCLAQGLFAVVPSYPMALLARGILGAGDALVWVSTLRVTAAHFSRRRYPLLLSLTSTLGTAGNIVATLPLSIMLHNVGWAPCFLAACVLTGIFSITAWLFIDDATPRPARIKGMAAIREGLSSVTTRVKVSWALPGTRAGFWVHGSTMCVANALGLLWGFPYLVKCAGFSSSAASTLMMICVIGAGVFSFAFALLISHWPHLRMVCALAICGLTMTGWLVAVSLGDHPPKAYVIVLFVVTWWGGPTSAASFPLARDYNHANILGIASGVVNVAGFALAIIITVGIGWVLDAFGGTSAHALRWAMLVGVAVQAFATWRLAVWFRRVRHFVLLEQARGIVMPVPANRRRWDLPEDFARPNVVRFRRKDSARDDD